MNVTQLKAMRALAASKCTVKRDGAVFRIMREGVQVGVASTWAGAVELASALAKEPS